MPFVGFADQNNNNKVILPVSTQNSQAIKMVQPNAKWLV